MSNVSITQPPNKFRELVDAPGGLTQQEAMSRARASLESLRGASLQAVGEKVEALFALASVRAPSDPECLGTLYRLANEIFAEGGLFGRDDCSAAAKSLCDLLAQPDLDLAARWSSVQVHAAAIKALNKPADAAGKAVRAQMLRGLNAVAAISS